MDTKKEWTCIPWTLVDKISFEMHTDCLRQRFDGPGIEKLLASNYSIRRNLKGQYFQVTGNAEVVFDKMEKRHYFFFWTETKINDYVLGFNPTNEEYRTFVRTLVYVTDLEDGEAIPQFNLIKKQFYQVEQEMKEECLDIFEICEKYEGMTPNEYRNTHPLAQK